jgi:predicted transcriptional regulator
MSPKRQAPSVADAELTVLRVLWEHGPSTVREVLELLPEGGKDWAYTTVQTLLLRLQDKGCVRSDKRDLAHVFAATVTRDELAGERIAEVVDSLLDGATAPLVLRLVEKGRFSASEIAHFRALLDAAERRQRAAKGKKGGDRGQGGKS